MTAYSVKPFSGANYHKNAKNCGSISPCAICGKPVKEPWPHAAVVINGGESWGNELADYNNPGYMGGFPVGKDCHRKYVV